ncbi:hypothetical protein AJ89_03095 [Lactococcus cremoris subsp. cremoris IBB477]|uniref:DUF1642 domain-containing protein n=1 Tax=Lactococcus cremoris subsp. cremoris IBB477 TaxID=1449093 RepID=A0A1E7G5Y0_LACLC|nr:DUF1642 domain-containing protein [Lactococcus cremoris]OEU40385.1 hypothetical protein AJ89_03095 [Lactococcus cremoris subsp. cremoris IBB477]
MTKFTNRIKPDSTELERYFLSVYTGNLWDALEKIKDWHSPEHIEKEVQMKLLKLQQQSLPVVPEDVAEWIEHCKGMGYGLIAALTFKLSSTMHEELSTKILKWLGNEGNDETFALAFITGKYQVEKPQLFYIDLPKVFGSSDSTSDSTFVSKAESGIILEFTKGKDYALKLTEQEIKSIDERYWQFAVPVEDGE